MAMGDQAAAAEFNPDPVIAHEPCENARISGGRDHGERQAAFSCAGWSGNEHAGFPNHNGACVQMDFIRIRRRSIRFYGQGLLRLRQKYNEAGAENRGQSVSARGTNPV